MIGAHSYDEAINKATHQLKNKRNQSNTDEAIYQMVGVLFARPVQTPATNEIVPNIHYFHERTGANFHFLMIGYGGSGSGTVPVFYGDPHSWHFSAKMFNSARLQFEEKTSWKYSGAADLILLDAVLRPSSDSAEFDFETAIVCQLDRMLSDKAIPSIQQFFEKIFQYADSAPKNDPTWGLSDTIGFEEGKSVLKRVILSLLPKELRRSYKNLEQFAVRDISKTEEKNIDDIEELVKQGKIDEANSKIRMQLRDMVGKGNLGVAFEKIMDWADYLDRLNHGKLADAWYSRGVYLAVTYVGRNEVYKQRTQAILNKSAFSSNNRLLDIINVSVNTDEKKNEQYFELKLIDDFSEYERWFSELLD